MLPNFICIGAQKCGTTTIWHLLNAHPDICMAQPRETHFFHDDLRFAEGLPKYEIEHFSHWTGQSAVGEKCPEYLFVPGVAKRIYDTLGPHVKFIVSLRSPARRAYSHYCHNLSMLREWRSFEEVLDTEEQQLQSGGQVHVPYGYVARCYYARQIEPYLALFDRKQFLFIHFERDLVTDQRMLCDRLFDFLEVQRFYPGQLPFQEGHARLKNLSIQINQNGDNPQKHFVEIARVDYSVSRAHRLFNRLRQPLRVTRTNQKHRIYNPSVTLLNFAHGFQQNKPMTSLSHCQEIAINRRYFCQEIEQLGSLMPSVIQQWLEG